MNTFAVFLRVTCLAVCCNMIAAIQGGMLYPRESESRQIQELNGMWNFRADRSPTRNVGLTEKWFQHKLSQTGPVIPMPVPSSYNDITTDKSLRDFVGWVWYDREFYVQSDFQNKRVVLRIDSAHYYSVVWINGQKVMEHNGGHLPFEAVVNSQLHFDKVNLVTVAVNNTLTPHTIPPGKIKYKNDTSRYPPGYFVQKLQFDFFNYAGIHRRVRLYTTPKTYIDDITILTNFSGASPYTGHINYTVTKFGNGSLKRVNVTVRDRNDSAVGSSSNLKDFITVSKAHLWWPYTQNEEYGYLYTLEVTLETIDGVDVYRLPFGIRTVRHTTKQFFINDRPFYCHGVAKHEDSDLRGKGLDFPLVARDFNMLKWLGANCFRTSHYPYAEEIMDQADQQGIVIIDECPAVGLQFEDNFGKITLKHHREVLEELVRRDKNRPAVVMWSVANEPASNKEVAQDYFKNVINHVRSIDDQHRPVTFVANVPVYSDLAAQYTDVQCINRYFGWYQDSGHTEVIQLQLKNDLDQWFDKLQKPLMITEYGAGTIVGMHELPSLMFTEEYQAEFMHQYHTAFDELRKDYLVGEMVWNFADFMTDQCEQTVVVDRTEARKVKLWKTSLSWDNRGPLGPQVWHKRGTLLAGAVNRVVGNRKGVLTRQRQPKLAAHLLRGRYWKLINQTLPNSNKLCQHPVL